MPTPRSPRARSRARWYAAGAIAAGVTAVNLIAAPSTSATPQAAGEPTPLAGEQAPLAAPAEAFVDTPAASPALPLPRTPDARPAELRDPRAERLAERRAEERVEFRAAVARWKRNLDHPLPSAHPCEDVAAATVASQVAEIFRCRLREAGYPEYRIRRIAAEAVTVAQCESGFIPHAVVFGGRYVHARHPGTGYFYTAAGVFQFIRDTANQWIDGGYANVLDSAKNIDAAARLFIANQAAGTRGWADWACAAANDGFRSTSVLPGYPGGPPYLPDWAWQY